MIASGVPHSHDTGRSYLPAGTVPDLLRVTAADIRALLLPTAHLLLLRLGLYAGRRVPRS